MVQSNVNRKIIYKEKRETDPDDKKYKSMPFEVELFGKEVIILFGKPNYTKIDDKIVFCYIYLIVNKKIYSKIGVLEFPTSQVSVMVIDDEINIEEIDESELLLFSFVNERFIDNAGSNISMFEEKQKESFIKDLEILNNNEKPKEIDIDIIELDLDDEDEAVKVRIREQDTSVIIDQNNEMLKDGVFQVDESIKVPKNLIEETEENDTQNRGDYKKKGSIRDNWLQKFFKNVDYGIHDVENNGDCLFAVIRDGFRQIGYKTSVKKLRALVAKHVTQKAFQEQRDLFLMLNSIKEGYEKERKQLRENNKQLKERSEKIGKKDRKMLSYLLEQSEELKARDKELEQLIDEQDTLIHENVSDFSSIETIEDYRKYIMSSSYWADSWAISILEKELQLKMVVLSERAYHDKDYDGILMCGEASEEMQKKGMFQPKHYIMTMFSGNHFQLVSYKEKRILGFSEIPYRIKGLVINKCMESQHGIYSLIPDFQDLQDRMGIDREINSNVDQDEQDHYHENNSMYESSTQFVFHKNSSQKPPGEGVHEKIKKDQIGFYAVLSTKPYKHWRRKLDDSYNESTFKVDNKTYASVEHYYQGAKFKHQNKDFQALFTLESQSEFSKNVDLAICAGSKSGKASKKCKENMKNKDLLLRPENIEIDTDFYDKRCREERMVALKSKFSQNESLKNVLLATRKAQLSHLDRGSPLKKDELLMAVREFLHNQEK